MKNTSFFSVATALKGMAMGIAEAIPGVSGGTIAFVTGIYERLLNSIKAFGPEAVTAYRTGGIPAMWKAINGNFLLSLLIGMAAGLIAGVFGITYLIEHHPILLWSFFFGLIIASTIYIAKQVPKWKIVELIALVFGIAIVYWITVAAPAQGNYALWFVFVSGAIAISAMLLPGISGSFILLLMGMYTYIIPTVKDAVKTFAPDKLLVLLVFGTGCLLGMATFARLLSWTFKNFQSPTLAMLTGFMVGSLNKIWPWRVPVLGMTEEGELVHWQAGVELDKIIKEMNVLPAQYQSATGMEPHLLGAIVVALIGIAVVFLLERFSRQENLVEEKVYH